MKEDPKIKELRVACQWQRSFEQAIKDSGLEKAINEIRKIIKEILENEKRRQEPISGEKREAQGNQKDFNNTYR